MFKSYYFSLLFWFTPILLPAQMVISFSTTPPCNNDGTITATVTGGTPPYSYFWYNNIYISPGVTNYCNANYPNSPTITGLHNKGYLNYQGYRLTVTDANGNTVNDYAFVLQNFDINPIITPAVCPLSNGSVALQVMGGVAPYSYSWMNGATTDTLTGLGLGDTYDVTVTDAMGCTIQLSDLDTTCASLTMKSSSNMTLNITTTPANCLDGTATVTVVSGGTAPFYYTWSNGQTTQTATNLVANQYYTITVIDANGCSKSQYVNIPSPTVITGTITSTPANCLDGTATVSNVLGGTTPYSYSWTNGQTSTTASNLVAGHAYLVNITDANSCKTTLYVSIGSNSTLQATSSATPETCINGNGTATLIANGGVLPYSFSWNNGQSTATIDSLSQGYYTGIVTDANGCSSAQLVYVGQYVPVIPNPSITGSVCNAPTGTITLAPTGGTAPYSYYWNTPPPQTTATATNLGIGSYSYTIVDSAGCIKSGNLLIGDNSTMTINVNANPNVCFAGNGSVQVNVVGGFPPYTYSWSNGGSSPNLSGLNTGWYRAFVTDSTGCMRKDSGQVNNFSPIMMSMAHTNASCIYVNDGTATVFASGGTPPYTYQWANGATTQSVSNLLPGNIGVTVTDAIGCSQSAYQNIGYNTVNGCAVSISGNVFDDQIQNCVHNNNEPYLKNILIQCSPNGGYDYTDNNGNYNFDGLVPGNYTLTQVNNPYITQLCPLGTINVSLPIAGMTSNGNTFADSLSVVNDLKIQGYNYPDIPITGNPYTNSIHVSNQSSIAQNPIVTCIHDANLIFTGANPSPTSYNATTHTITWNLASLNAFNGNTQVVQVHYQVPLTTVFGTVLAFSLSVSPNINDITPQDNIYTFNTTVVSSYDPNYIEVSPKGEGVLGLITSDDSILHYVIHFQNTGTWAAKTVEIRQPLDSHFNISSINPQASSHQYKARISSDNTLIFTFDNINLPDSATNEPESHGFVAYTVHLKKYLPFGTELTAQAAIYFDYNAPVMTNTVLNTIKSPNIPSANDIILYPNPAKDLINIEAKDIRNQITFVEIFNIWGILLSQNTLISAENGLYKALNISSLSNGLYILKFTTQEGVISKKFLISR